jgi:hypothetical protein
METLVFGIVVAIFIAAGAWIGSSKSEKDLTLGLVLFPNIFKTIGIIITVVSIAFVTYFALHIKEIWESIVMHGINLGLFFYCFAKDKLEDELTRSVRLRAFYTSVIVGIVLLVSTSFVEFLMGDKEYVYSATKLVTVILGVYAFSYVKLRRKVFYGK